jgi:hypothetical protein
MRKSLMLTAAFLLLGAPAFAQTAPSSSTGTSAATQDDASPTPMPRHHAARMRSGMTAEGTRPGHEPGVGESEPASTRASNIDSADTRSAIAPRLPTPRGGANATPEQYLRDAQSALAANRTGAAQEALERAETRLLDRSTPAGATDTPAQNPMASTIAQARDALGRHDTAQARELIRQAMTQTSSASDMSTGAGGTAPMGSRAPMGTMPANGTMPSSGTGATAPMGTGNSRM